MADNDSVQIYLHMYFTEKKRAVSEGKGAPDYCIYNNKYVDFVCLLEKL